MIGPAFPLVLWLVLSIVAPAEEQCRAGLAGLAKKYDVPEVRLKKGLRRHNSREMTRKGWCDLSAEDLGEIVAYARTKKEALSEHREEWLRFTLGDEKGSIAAGGLAHALMQRKDAVTSAIAALPSSAAGWTNVTGYVHPVGRMNDLLIHPTSTGTMWAGTDGGGIWKTTDGGTTWQAANDFLASLSISSFAMRSGDPSTIYAATGAQGSHTGTGGAGIFKSTDGGTVWTLLASTSPATNFDFTRVYDLAISPTSSNVVIAATDGGAYITADGGAIWTEIAAAAARTRNVAIHPANSNLRVIAMDDGTVRISTDGTSYNPYTIATTTGTTLTRLALAPSDQDIMYALLSNGGNSELYRSETGGTLWSLVPEPAPPNEFFWNGYLGYTGGLWVDPTNPNHIVVVEAWAAVIADASSPTPVWIESNYGWVDFRGAVSHPNYNGTSNKTVFLLDDGGIYRWNDIDTMNSVAPAYLAPNGINVTQAYTVAGRGGALIFGAQDVASRFYRSTTGDPVQKWRFATGLGGHDGAATAADRTNPNILYGSTQFLGIHRSTNGGQSTGFICQGITDVTCTGYSGNAAFIAPFVLDPNNQSRMLAGAASLWRSNDVATGAPPAWTAIHSGVASRISAIAVAPSNSDVIWIAYQNGQVYKTANGTATTPVWGQVTSVPTGNKLRMTIDRTNDQKVYIGLSGFLANRLHVTSNGGTNWSAVAGLPNASVFAIQQHPLVASWLYAGTAVGLFASDDNGATWSTTNEGPANVQVRDLQWYSESATSAQLLVATFGRGIWRAALDVLTAPTGFTASTTELGDVALQWTGVAGATSYKIYRSSNRFSFVEIATTSNTAYVDNSVVNGTAYLYRVRASSGSSESPDSNFDLGSAIVFTDPELVAGSTPVKALHVSELRDAVNAVLTLAATGSPTFTDDPLSSSVIIRRAHLVELRDALNLARAGLTLPNITWNDPVITSGVTAIKAGHFDQLRMGVQ